MKTVMIYLFNILNLKIKIVNGIDNNDDSSLILTKQDDLMCVFNKILFFSYWKSSDLDIHIEYLE